MKKIILTLTVLLLAFTLFAGGSKEAADGAAGAVKIGLIVENTIDDKGWCQSMYDGLVQAKEELGDRMEFSYTEKVSTVDAGTYIRQFVAEGYDLIIAHGAQYKNAILEVAEEYPDVAFAFGTSSEIGPDNVFTYMPESEETGYLSGIIAGMMTKSGKVGMVGPVDSGDAARYMRGYIMGVEAVNPDAQVSTTLSGDFSDYVKAGEIATTLIANGCDVLTGASQQAIGALNATASTDALWVGQDLAQLDTAEGQAKCLAASAYNYKAVVIGLVESLENGIKGGQCIPMNFNNGGFRFGYNEALDVPAEVKAKVEQALDEFTASSGLLADYASVEL